MRHSSTALASNNESLFRFRGLAPSAVFGRMPELRGSRIHVSFRPNLTAYRGELLSKSHKGDAVYAGSFLRKRRIVLEEQMLRTPRVLERIFVHEVFHFVWSKLGNTLRQSYEQLLLSELRRRAKGELGWSAERIKLQLTPDDLRLKTRRWKDYMCESFCDSAGWFFGSSRRYSEMTLDSRFRDVRRRWIRENLLDRRLSV
jgi:hypothetical protein